MKFTINYPEAESHGMRPLLEAIETIVNNLPRGMWNVETDGVYDMNTTLARRTPTEEMRYCPRMQYFYTRIGKNYHIIAKRGYADYIDDSYQKGLIKTETTAPPVDWVAP